jgi:spore coat protein U-like protein
MSRFRPGGPVGRLALALACLAAPMGANAVISCSVSATSVTASFNNAFGSVSINSGAWTISCTRALSDPNTFSWQLGANNGLQPSGGSQNRAISGANTINYDVYRAETGTQWRDTATTRFTGTVTFAGGALNAQQIGTFWVRVPTGAGQNPPAGTYTDTVTVTLRDSVGTSIGTTTFNVSIDVRAACEITNAPGDLSFSYVAFQAAAVPASTTYAVRCTNGSPYSMALDASSSTLLGLTYTLSLSATNVTGTGNSQTFTINGSIAGGQAGTCATASCSGTQTRTLTITY